MVWGKGWDSLFCIWIFNCFSVICWKIHICSHLALLLLCWLQPWLLWLSTLTSSPLSQRPIDFIAINELLWPLLPSTLVCRGRAIMNFLIMMVLFSSAHSWWLWWMVCPLGLLMVWNPWVGCQAFHNTAGPVYLTHKPFIRFLYHLLW